MKFKGAFGIFVILIVVFSSLLLLVMLASFIDSSFYNGEGILALQAKYGGKLGGIMMVVIMGFSMLMLFFGIMQNVQFYSAFESSIDKSEEVDKAKLRHPVTQNREGIMEMAESYSYTDPAFGRLFARFKSYLGSFSGSVSYKPNQAIDGYNGGGGGMLGVLIGPGFLVVFLIIVQLSLMVHIKNTTGLEVGEALSATRQTNPTLFLPIVVVSVLAALYLIISYVLSLAKNVFGFVWSKMPDSNEGEAPVDTQYRIFFNQKIQFQHIPIRRLIYKGIVICSYVPLISGILIMDSLIIRVAAPCMAFGILMLMFDNGKAESFVVSEKGWVRFMPLWGKTIDFSLADCEGVIVRYQSQLRNTGINSGGLERGFMNNIVISIMDIPGLIPQAIIFYLKNEKPVVLSLRFLAIGKDNWIDSHEVEFYFAFMLKQYGFQFEVPENKELAGDWKAENPKYQSTT